VRELSARQQKIMGFIQRFWGDRHYPPTVRDIVSGCNISSTSVVDYNLDILEREGYIRRHAGISRGIELLTGGIETGVRVPLIGLIAAGSPIPVPSADAWNPAASAETIDVSPDIARGKHDLYALKVKGTSMIDDLINDGDLVLMQVASTVEDGETAAVWLKGEKEATLKKVYRERGLIRLQPANERMQPIYTRPENVEVQGKVVAVIRKVA